MLTFNGPTRLAEVVSGKEETSFSITALPADLLSLEHHDRTATGILAHIRGERREQV